MARRSLIAALALVTAGAIALPHVAFAAPLAQPNQARIAEVAKGDVNIEPAAQYWRKKRPGYDRHRHGDRYRYKHGRYTHYHNGWYYNSPWWIAGPLIGGALLGGAFGAPRYDGGDNHVEWCLDRYRSYNPRTDSFLGYDGEYHRCNSPY
ncbi:MAG: BA14K family protein [Hyphomicrobiales bacterium]